MARCRQAGSQNLVCTCSPDCSGRLDYSAISNIGTTKEHSQGLKRQTDVASTKGARRLFMPVGQCSLEHQHARLSNSQLALTPPDVSTVTVMITMTHEWCTAPAFVLMVPLSSMVPPKMLTSGLATTTRVLTTTAMMTSTSTMEPAPASRSTRALQRGPCHADLGRQQTW